MYILIQCCVNKVFASGIYELLFLTKFVYLFNIQSTKENNTKTKIKMIVNNT